MKSPSYEKEDPDGYLPTPGHPVPFNVALEGRFRISSRISERRVDQSDFTALGSWAVTRTIASYPF
jgi:hypothetical protein